MGCPKAYDDELKAKLAGQKISVQSRGKQEPVPYKCNKCPKWHLKEGK